VLVLTPITPFTCQVGPQAAYGDLLFVLLQHSGAMKRSTIFVYLAALLLLLLEALATGKQARCHKRSMLPCWKLDVLHSELPCAAQAAMLRMRTLAPQKTAAAPYCDSCRMLLSHCAVSSMFL
jgi:hypothetical protein